MSEHGKPTKGSILDWTAEDEDGSLGKPLAEDEQKPTTSLSKKDVVGHLSEHGAEALAVIFAIIILFFIWRGDISLSPQTYLDLLDKVPGVNIGDSDNVNSFDFWQYEHDHPDDYLSMIKEFGLDIQQRSSYDLQSGNYLLFPEGLNSDARISVTRNDEAYPVETTGTVAEQTFELDDLENWYILRQSDSSGKIIAIEITRPVTLSFETPQQTVNINPSIFAD